MPTSEAVIMSVSTTTLRAAVLGIMLVVVPPGLRAQSSPCGPETISINFPEYPNAQGVVLIPQNEQSSYRKQIVQSDNVALQLTITEDPDNPSDPQLSPDSTTLEVQYNALSVPRGFDLLLKKGVDRDGTSATADDDRNTLQYKMECVDPTNSSMVYFHVLKIQIVDDNDNSPQFQGEPYEITVNELTPVGITVYSSISTTDLDNGTNKLVKYSIATAPTSQFTDNGVFMLPSEDRAFVVLRQPLDYEAMVNQVGSGLLAVYRMNITATDQAQEFTPLSNWAYLNITIEDGDDLGPNFIYASCPSTPFKSCVRPKFSASIESGTSTPVAGSLQVLPIPRLTDPTQTVPIRARDGDSLNAVIQCSIAYTVPAGYESRFTVSTSPTGTAGEYQCNVRVSTPINRADVPSLDVVVQATEQTSNSYSEEAVITLDITPRNQNAPTLSTNSGAFQGYILENSAVGTLVSNDTALRGPLRLLVSDLDVSANDPPGNYEITLSPVIGFQVDAFGYIQFVQGTLDFETRQQYTFEAVVRELDTTERRSSTASLTINVLDINDNAPSVTSGLLQTSVSEGDYSGGVGQFLVQVNANDADSGVNAQLDYAILSVFPSASTSIFSIDNNGRIILQGAVVAGNSFTLQTQVSDRGTPNQRTNVAVIVDVTPVGNQPPQFTASNYTIYVSEAVPLQSSLWNIPASDPEGDALTYSIDNSVPQANAFDTLSDSLGNQILRNIITLNREQVDTHTLTLSVADNGGNRASATVTVIVLDVNDNSPRFNPTDYIFDIDENQNPGTSVGQVSATDADRQNTPFSSISYSIQPASNDFQVDISNGQITSRRPFDYEIQKNFTFTVLATDGGGNIGVARVIVRVRDLQDTVPVFDRTYTFFVDEGSTGLTVGSVTATDLDSTYNIQYQFTGGDSSAFSINTLSGLIQTSQALDYNVKNQYVFTVTTSDGAGSTAQSASATVTVNVNDINNFTPVITVAPSTTITLLENVNVGTTVVDVDATDQDPAGTANSRITYSIVSVSPPTGSQYFFIRGDSGLLTVAGPLKDAPSDQYNLTVRATDAGSIPQSRSADATITVNIVRNTPPRFASATVTLPELRVDQTTVSYVVSAIDPDTNPEFRITSYSLYGDSTATRFFTVGNIVGTNGAVTGGSITIIDPTGLRADSNTQYRLEVLVEDGAGETARQTLILPVNRNLNVPEFLAPRIYNISIEETRQLAVSIVTVSGRDLDQGIWGQLSFNIVDDGSGAVSYFDIVTNGANTGGNVRLVQTLVNSGRDRYQLEVELRDGGGVVAVDRATVIVNVLRNTQPPIFFTQIYNVTISERTPISQSIVLVSASDADTNSDFNQITYSILEDLDKQSQDFFSLNPAVPGEIRVSGDLTTTPTDLFLVRVQAEDNGLPPRRGFALVYVYVTRNFNRPVWSATSYTTTVPETQSIGSVFYTVTVSDNDSQPPNNQVDCILTGDAEALKYFEVAYTGNNNGVNTCGITARSLLFFDPNRPPQYNLVLKARDGGSPSQEAVQDVPVTVFVTRNRFAPNFVNDPYERVVSPDVTPTDLLFTVSATDADPSPFNVITYQLYMPEGRTELFDVDPNNGQITLKPGTSFAGTETVYTAYVRATDSGIPALSDTAVMRFIVDRNRNAPSFTDTSKTFNINEDQEPGAIIGSCTATDNDRGTANAPANSYLLTYSGTGSALTYFDYNPQTGVVYAKRDLALDTSGGNRQYFLQLTARDNAEYPKAAANTCSITINVARNLFPPVFQNTPYVFTINRTALGGVLVSDTIRATDADAPGPYGTVKYNILEQGVPGLFSIDENSGQFRLARDISTQTGTVFYLTVRAYDSGTPAREDFELVSVTVDQNLFPPVFDIPKYEATTEILETSAVNSVFFTVMTSDLDASTPYNTPFYYLVAGQPNAEIYFQINSNGGVSLRTSVLADTLDSYILRIGAQDGGSPPKTAINTATLTVSVYRDQFTPQFQNVNNYPTTISENMAVGTFVTQVTATDLDRVNTYERVSYSLAGDNPSPAYFAVDSTGRITLTNSLAGTQQEYFVVRVRASDNGSPNLVNDTVFRVTVNKNLNDPQWIGNTLYEVTIQSTQSLGVPIITLRANDADTTAPYNQTVFFALSPTNSAFNWFQFDQNGEISVRVPLYDNTNRDQRFEWQMGIRDGGNPPREQAIRATVVVNVVYNQNAPAFTGCTPQPRISLREDIASGTNVYTATVSDSDLQSPFNSVSLRIIGDDNAPGLFRLDPNPGSPNQRLLVVDGDLTQDTDNEYTVRILAEDGGRPSQSATCVVTFAINRNLNTPSFTDTSYSATVSECVAFDTSVAQVSATDSDRTAPYNTLTFEVNNNYFYVLTQPNGVGIVRVRRDLRSDSTGQTTYTFPVTVRDGSGLSTSVSMTVNVRRNQFTPAFTDVGNTGFSVTVDDDLTVGGTVYDAEATDADSNSGTEALFSTLTYTLVGDGTAVQYFAMNAGTGLITATRTIRDLDTNFNLQMQVCDQGCPARCSPIRTLTVNVNRNRNRPVFASASYTATISEEALYGSSVQTVSAQDLDFLAPYNSVFYDLVLPNSQFALDRQSGVISVRTDLTRETAPSFTFDVRAQDGAGLTSTATAQVLVNIIRNDNDPVFTNTGCSVSLNDNSAPGAEVLIVTATDADSDTLGTTGIPSNFGSQSLRYSLIGDDGQQNFFSISSPSTGRVTLGQSINSDTASTYRLRILVQDGARFARSAVKVCQVNVNRDPNPPIVTPLNANTRILEIQDPGQTIITINATDNAGRTPDVFFTLVNNDAQDQVCNAYFGIFRTGGLYVRSDLVADTLDRTQYICRVIATENNPPSRQSTNTGTVTVTVVRNTPPSFVNSPYTATINRDAADNALVTTYTTTDGDSDIPFSQTDVSIIGRNDNGYFALGGANNIVLQSANGLTGDSRSSYTLVLQVRDRGQRAALSSTAVVNINVVRNLFSPVCEDNNQVISINFTTPPGDTIGTFRATDNDPGQAVKYVLTGTVSSKSYFSVDYDTGDITLIRALAATGNPNYQLSVSAIDNGFPSRTTGCQKTVQVNVDASTLAFTFPDYERTISENNLPPFQMVDLDTSPNDRVFFQVIGLNNDMEWFNIDQTTGSITVAKDLRTDPAKRVVYQLLVQATRQSTVTRQTATASVTINVQRNENSPVFTGNYFRTVDERLWLGSSVVQLSAQDADVNDRLTFRYDSPNADTQLFYLGPSSGLISLNQSLVGLTRDLIQFAIVVEDNAVVNPKSATATVTVSITRDTQPPHFLNDPYSTTINYNLNVGASVFMATATDPDLLGALTYETDNAYLAAPAFFNIERLTGQVVVQNPLTSDSAQSYVLRLKVYDSARPDNFDLTNITINVDRNPSFPAFTPLTYQNRIPETFPPSSEIFTLVASDSDPGQKLQYGIVSATPVNCDDYFFLNVLTGRVSPYQSLTNSGFDRCVITFSVQDNGDPSKSASNSTTGTIDIHRNVFSTTFQATEQTPTSYSEITPRNMSSPHTTTMPTTSGGPSEKDGLDAGAVVRAVLGVVAAVDFIVALLVIFLRSTLFREEADVPVSGMVKRSSWQGDSGASVLRDTTAVNAGISLLLVGSSTENGASQCQSSETDDDYEIADATSTQQDLEPAASTTDPTCVEILDDELAHN